MNDEFLVNNPNVNNILKIRDKKISRFELVKYAWNELRRSHYDLIIEQTGVSGATISFFCLLTRAKYRIGINDPISGFSNTVNLTNIIQPNWDGKSTFIENALKVMNVLGQSNFDSRPEIFLPQEVTEYERAFFINNGIDPTHFILGIHVGSDYNSKGRRWEVQKYIRLINKLLNEHKNLIILYFGGPDEEAETIEVKEYCKDKRIVFSQDNLVRTAALLRKCHLFISNDNLMLHLAVTLETNSIGIFGPTNPYISYSHDKNANKHFFPIYLNLDCQPCWISPPVICKYGDFRCLEQISVEKVLTTFEDVYMKLLEDKGI